MTRDPLTRIRRAFNREFWLHAGKFEEYVLAEDQWRDRDLHGAIRPGVYIWIDVGRDAIIKVGLSAVNPRARALQHIRDDTAGEMSALADNPDARMVLYTLAEEDKHWAAALEIYLERELQPEIQAKR